MPELSLERFASYVTYSELESLLKLAEASYPGLVKITSAGKSREGREQWVAVVTNQSTGGASSKPAMYIDGNHHAGEVTGSATCLYTIAYLLNNYGVDSSITEILDTKAFYIMPRVSPDGAEIYLTTPYTLRSTPRLWPFERECDGVYPEDINGDGVIVQMRVPDKNGEFKVSSKDSRLMVRRLPDDTSGQYYRLYLEGYARGYDGAEVKMAPPKWGLDLNRNYPVNWGNEVKQPGSGPYPMSEPETRGVADFLAGHDNICAVMSYHTTGGIILRPRCTASDLDLPGKDLIMFRSLGNRGTELTGYPCKSIFEGFTRDKRKPSVGSFLDFSYDHMGLLSFATELWDLRKRAGIPDRDMTQWSLTTEADEEQDGLKILNWIDAQNGGQGFMAWTRVLHPQFGEVEVGGIEGKFLMQNPPKSLLMQECHKNMLFTLAVLKASAVIEVSEPEVRRVGNDCYSVSVVVTNAGYMPTSGSDQAVVTRTARPVTARISVPDGAVLVNSKQTQDLGHLPGRAIGAASTSPGGSSRKASWFVDMSAAKDKAIGIEVDGYRGGKKSLTVAL